jgi:hypothetical protein
MNTLLFLLDESYTENTRKAHQTAIPIINNRYMSICSKTNAYCYIHIKN